jgi:hypothetical protein
MPAILAGIAIFVIAAGALFASCRHQFDAQTQHSPATPPPAWRWALQFWDTNIAMHLPQAHPLAFTPA